MQEARWDNLIARLENAPGGVSIKNRKDIQTDDLGHELITEVEYVETELAGNKYRIEKHTRPVILDKKAHYNHSGGNRANLEFVLSPDEKTSFLKVFKYLEDEDDWEEVNQGSGSFSL